MFRVFAVVLLLAAAQTNASQGHDILETAGIQGGLIVHVGCGDGRLTAALRADDRCIVHGLDADTKNVEAARKHIQSL
jgi:2-polyprenyl-3-methyl-5-hydroxy-6-metoxy-1,4-benzoquinol methylase